MGQPDRLLRSEPAAEVLLVDPNDRSRIARLHHMQIGAWIMVATAGLFAITVFSLWPRQFAENPWVGAIGVSAILVTEVTALVLNKRTVLLSSPLTRRELNTYPGDVATRIRIGLSTLMPAGIGEGQCCPQSVALDRRLGQRHADCWDTVAAARGAKSAATHAPHQS